MRKRFAIALIFILLMNLTGCAGSASSKETDENTLYVYNWGEYIDPDILTMFTEETGIEVVYDEYETNEIMYPKIKAGAVNYDLVCPSDYMITKMIENDLLQEIDFENIPDHQNIGKEYWKMAEGFDPGNHYAMPYVFGTVGILYNKTMVKEKVDSWGILWDPKYKDEILMQDSVRDAFLVAEKYLGYSLNTTDEDELQESKKLLQQQKELVQAYVIDQVRDKMIGNEAALGVIYSGEAIYTQRENPDLDYVIPKEGTTLWMDCWVIPKNAQHKENAEKFLNFLCRADIAYKNFDYITYSTPNMAARELIEDEDIKNSPIAFPDLSKYDLETQISLGETADRHLNDLWREVKSY
ncbi:ABC transporter substrate-binding protein [Butyrivibrio sp. AE3004]|uniref:ABC transporter substrate-binding protein n=1 Tax=Butyrivibrio sp. AE3004 TaxID=1506994 RepID=UPI00049424D1|nr:ABC transporter substrate-binding protein [Butyrivibrio sp. AE3004]